MLSELLSKILFFTEAPVGTMIGAPSDLTELPLTGIKDFNLNHFGGLQIGWLTWPTFIGVVFAVIAFVVGAFYIIQYNKGFFAGRAIPKSWKLIMWGVFVTAIAELGEIAVFYELPKVGMIEAMLAILPHMLGGVLLALGAYFLYKEVTT
ncbi:MAG: hypothetical protein V1841_01005 [Patescibacteria group bacterium]